MTTRRNDDDDARYDLDRLRPTDEDLKAYDAARLALRKPKARGITAAGPRLIGHSPFVRYSVEAILRLAGAKHIGTVKLYGWLLHLDWKNDHRPFKLTNGAVAPLKINRNQKGFALRELQGLGLVQVEYRPRKSPLVTVPGGDLAAQSVI
jgi:hypothetical protein